LHGPFALLAIRVAASKTPVRDSNTLPDAARAGFARPAGGAARAGYRTIPSGAIEKRILPPVRLCGRGRALLDCGRIGRRPGGRVAGPHSRISKESMPMEAYERLKQLVESCADDIAKAEGGNKAAGTRVRKAMQDIKNTAQEVRKGIL